jgi:hypothetical protein
MFNSTKEISRDVVMGLRRNRTLLSHYRRNQDIIPPHFKPQPKLAKILKDRHAK